MECSPRSHSPEFKRLGREADHPAPYSAYVLNAWCHTSSSHSSQRGIKDDSLIFIVDFVVFVSSYVVSKSAMLLANGTTQHFKWDPSH